MKINLIRPVKDLKGNPITQEGDPVLLRDLAVGALLSHAGRQNDGSTDMVYKRYSLAGRISTTGGEVELASEEVSLIKEVAGQFLTVLAFGRLVDALEQRDSD